MKITKTHAQIAAGAFAALAVLKLVLSPDDFSGGLMRWLAIVLAAGAGYALGWLFSPPGAVLRRIVGYGAAALAVAVAFLAPHPVGTIASYILSFVAFFVAIALWGSNRRDDGDLTPFGTAQWATEEHLRANGAIGETGLRLGEFAGRNGLVPLHYTGERHLLTIAPTRSGKGVNAIIPNLLTYAGGSALVIDPKGENAMVTAEARRRMGQTIHIVDPWMVATSQPSRFNPLDWLVPGDPDITENAMLLADALTVSESHGDKFWVEEAKALLQGVILYVATDEREAGMRHLGRVRELMLLDGEDLSLLFQRMTESRHHVVVSTGARCLQKDEKLLSSVLASAQVQTHFLDSPRVCESLAASDFKFEDLKTGGVTVYLVLPADRLQPFERWLRLLIQQAITVNARSIEMRPERPVLFLLDEMAALGRLSAVETSYGLMAGFGIQLWGIVQDAGQLKGIYGDRWEGFIANSGAIAYHGSRDRMTAEYFSALCGETTVWTLSSAIARTIGGGNSNTSITKTSSASQRKLAHADELMRMDATRQLIFIDNLNPIVGVKRRWFEDDTLKTQGRNLRAEGKQP